MLIEDDEWSTFNPNISASEVQQKIEHAPQISPIILEHWFYRGSRAPTRLIFDEYDELVEYMKSNAHPGDAFHFWSYSELCRDDNTIAHGKFPDERGRTPKRGAY